MTGSLLIKNPKVIDHNKKQLNRFGTGKANHHGYGAHISYERY
jgi:hypothetical protein